MELYHEIRGTGDLNLLFLHGFMGSIRDWTPVLPYFENIYRCILPDLPGHGNSVAPNLTSNWSIENTAAAIIRMLAQNDVRQCIPVGYSMGGRLALYLIIHYPHYFPAAILESASPGLATAAQRKKRLHKDAQLAATLEAIALPDFLGQWYALPLFETLRHHPQFPKLMQRRLQNDPSALAKSLRDMGTGSQPSLWQQLKSAKFPLLLVVGEKDAKFRTIAADMHRKNPAFMQAVVSGAGHNIHIEQPHAFADVVTAFLKKMHDSGVNPL